MDATKGGKRSNFLTDFLSSTLVPQVAKNAHTAANDLVKALEGMKNNQQFLRVARDKDSEDAAGVFGYGQLRAGACGPCPCVALLASQRAEDRHLHPLQARRHHGRRDRCPGAAARLQNASILFPAYAPLVRHLFVVAPMPGRGASGQCRDHHGSAATEQSIIDES